MQTDLRTRYTRQVITDAYLQLLRQKPAAHITVKEVCTLAQINRSTFYRQYRDCLDLQEQLEQQALDAMEEMLDSMEAHGAEAVVTAMLRTLRDNESLLGVLSRQGQSERFLYAMTGRCFRYMDERADHMAPVPGQRQQEMRSAFLAAGSGGVIEYWLHRGTPEPPEQVAAVIIALCSGAAGAKLPR